jgi:GTPase
VSGSVEEFEAEQDDGHTEYKYKLVQPTPERIQHLVTQMNYRLTEGQGQAFYMLGVEDGGCPKG